MIRVSTVAGQLIITFVLSTFAIFATGDVKPPITLSADGHNADGVSFPFSLFPFPFSLFPFRYLTNGRLGSVIGDEAAVLGSTGLVVSPSIL